MSLSNEQRDIVCCSVRQVAARINQYASHIFPPLQPLFWYFPTIFDIRRDGLTAILAISLYLRLNKNCRPRQNVIGNRAQPSSVRSIVCRPSERRMYFRGLVGCAASPPSFLTHAGRLRS